LQQKPDKEAATMASIPAQEEFLAVTRKSQEAMITAIKTWVETVRTVTPRFTSVYAPLTDYLPKLPSVTVPFVDQLPTPKDAVASAYDLAEQLLASQRKFAEDLLRAMTPVTADRGTSAPKSVSQSAPQGTAADGEPKPTASPARRRTPASTAPKGTASKSTATKSTAAKSTATNSAAAKSTAAKSTAADSAAADSPAKGTPAESTPESPAPKGATAS
jgi:hypothetical protein